MDNRGPEGEKVVRNRGHENEVEQTELPFHGSTPN